MAAAYLAAELRLDRAVDELDQRVDHALVVNHHVDAVERQAEQPVCLDHFEAFVHQGGRIDGDLGAHCSR